MSWGVMILDKQNKILLLPITLAIGAACVALIFMLAEEVDLGDFFQFNGNNITVVDTTEPVNNTATEDQAAADHRTNDTVKTRLVAKTDEMIEIGSDSAFVYGWVDYNGDSSLRKYFQYGLQSGDYTGIPNILTSDYGEYPYEFGMLLEQLKPGQRYYYRLVVEELDTGRTVYGEERSFVTKSGGD